MRKISTITLTLLALTSTPSFSSTPVTRCIKSGFIVRVDSARLSLQKSKRKIQEAILSSIRDVRQVLHWAAESTEYFDGNEFTGHDFDISVDSIIGLSTIPTSDNITGAITFTFDASEIKADMQIGGKFHIKFTPLITELPNGTKRLECWKCESDAAYQGVDSDGNVLPGWRKPTVGQLDYLTEDLGPPFNMCAVMLPVETPAETEGGTA